MGEIVVHGMIGSPFVRSVLVVLEEKQRAYRLVPLKLDALRTPDYRALHPFGRVPVFEQDGFVVYETQAILRHIDRAFPQPRMTPVALEAAARMDQVLSTIDHYLFAKGGEVLGFQRIIAPRFLKQASDEAACADAEIRVARTIDVLADVLGEKPCLTGAALTLADVALGCHLEFLASTPEGERTIAARPALGSFLSRLGTRPSFVETTIPALARRFLPPKRG